MRYRNILVPYDKSEPAKHALAAAIDISADDPATTINIAYVVDLPEYDDASYRAAAARAGVADESVEDLQKLRDAYFDEALEDLKEDITPQVDDCKGTIIFNLLQGKPDSAIVKFSEESGSDIIIMGCRGLGAVRGMVGSVSYGVLRHAEMPVLIVK